MVKKFLFGDKKIIVSSFVLFLFLAGGLGPVFAQSALPTGGSNFDTATPLISGKYQGSFSEGDARFYRLQGGAGQEIKVEVNTGNVELILYNDEKEELQFSNEFVHWLPNSEKSIHTFYLKVSNESFGPIDFILNFFLINYYDANSLTDAGDTFEKAINIGIGEHQGYLAGYYPAMTPKGDDLKDYYKISVEKGITYTFKATPPATDAISLELFNFNRESIDEKSSTNPGAIVNLSLTPAADTTIFIGVSPASSITGEVLSYKLDIKKSGSLTKFFVCKEERCEMAGEYSSLTECQKATTKICYETSDCNSACSKAPPTTIISPTTSTKLPPTTVVPPTTVTVISPCQDTCSIGQTQCFDNFNYQKCGNFDDDKCLEWSSMAYCGEGYKCEKGKCVKTSGCQCSAWINEECQGGNCKENERHQVRTCEPENCDKEEQCLVDDSCQTVIEECLRNSDCLEGFVCQERKCVFKGEGEWWKWFSLIGIGGWFGGWYLLVWLAFYIYFALCLQIIANKTNTPNGWMAWIPIANVFLMIQIAQKPLWWFVLLLIPLVNIVMTIIIWMAIAEKRNKPNWWGILIIVPIINLIVPGYLAFSGDGTGEITPPYTPTGTQEANKPTVGYKHPCKYCGELIPPDSTVCPFCGKSNPLGPMRCPKCHEPVEKEWLVCSKCGQNLRIVCPYCGKITFFGDQCEDCGARLIVKCPYCGQEQPPLSDKCIKCGKSLKKVK